MTTRWLHWVLSELCMSGNFFFQNIKRLSFYVILQASKAHTKVIFLMWPWGITIILINLSVCASTKFNPLKWSILRCWQYNCFSRWLVYFVLSKKRNHQIAQFWSAWVFLEGRDLGGPLITNVLKSEKWNNGINNITVPKCCTFFLPSSPLPVLFLLILSPFSFCLPCFSHLHFFSYFSIFASNLFSCLFSMQVFHSAQLP